MWAMSLPHFQTFGTTARSARSWDGHLKWWTEQCNDAELGDIHQLHWQGSDEPEECPASHYP